jgi:opacity protein-like surface antigen
MRLSRASDRHRKRLPPCKKPTPRSGGRSSRNSASRRSNRPKTHPCAQRGDRYNWQFAPTWVAGLEADWSWAKTGGSFDQPWVTNPGSAVVTGSFTIMGSSLDWVSSLRARLGYLVLPNLMAFGTVGGAWGEID